MNLPRISASSYSNTAPLIWSFLFGSLHGAAEIILDNAPARSAELLGSGRVDSALVPVIAFQEIPNVRLVPDVCVGSLQKVRSVCLVTRGKDLPDVESVALDVSSRTSVALTRIIFREFLGKNPDWQAASPDVDKMLASADCALLIGDPALALTVPDEKNEEFRVFDLAELWHKHTGLGFVFAMWMARDQPVPDFRAARDEGLRHLDDIISNYKDEIPLTRDEFRTYLTRNISYEVTPEMEEGMRTYFSLCEKYGLIKGVRDISYV